MKYPKLVRDKIPNLIRQRGANPHTRVLDQEDLYPWLLIKLREEILEFEEEPSVKELADIYEVLLALGSTLGITATEIELEREQKYRECGGFQERIILEGITERQSAAKFENKRPA